MKTNIDKVKNGLIPVVKFAVKGGIVLDLQDVFKRFTFDTTCIVLTGFEPGCLYLELADVPLKTCVSYTIYCTNVFGSCNNGLELGLKRN